MIAQCELPSRPTAPSALWRLRNAGHLCFPLSYTEFEGRDTQLGEGRGKILLCIRGIWSEACPCGTQMDGRISPAAAPSGTAEQAACAACAQHRPEGSGVQLRWRAAHGLGFPGTGSSLQTLRAQLHTGRPQRPPQGPRLGSMPSASQRGALLGAARRGGGSSDRCARPLGGAPCSAPGSGDERPPWRPWWGSSVTRGAPSRMISTMAATWPRPASTSAWVRTADGWESRTAPPQPPSTCGEVPLPAVAGRWGDALRSRQVPLWHPGHLRPWAALGLRAVF